MAERYAKYRTLDSKENSFLYPPESLKAPLEVQSEPPKSAVEGVLEVRGSATPLEPLVKHRG